MQCVSSPMFLLFINLFFTVAGPEKGPEWLGTRDASHLESLVCISIIS